MDDLGNDGLLSLHLWLSLILFTPIGLFTGMIVAMIVAFVVERLSQSSYAYGAIQVFPWTLGGSFTGLSIALLAAIRLVQCVNSSQKCILPISFELADLAVRLVGVVPSLGAIIGSVVYWRRYRFY
jgi:hypothetical protein